MAGETGSNRELGRPGRGAAALIAVWALTLIALAGGAVWLELTYTPPETAATPEGEAPAETAESTAPAPVDSPTRETGGETPPAESQHASATTETGGGEESDAAGKPGGETGAGEAPSGEPTGDSGDPPSRGEGTSEDSAPAEIQLAAAPDPELVESQEVGLLPVAGPNGRVPRRVYSRPFLGDSQAPRIAVVIQSIGLSQDATEAAIAELPPEVTFALSPYADSPQDLARRSRKAGHEVLLMVPMEPVAYPDNDPGPDTLLTRLPEEELLSRLHTVMSRFQGYVGLVNHMGSRFTADRQALEPVMQDLAGRGLLFLDARTSAESVAGEAARAAGVPAVTSSRYIDNTLTAEAIDGHLAALEETAKRRGWAIGMGRPYPVTIERVRAWAANLESRDAVLAPVSAVAAMQRDGRS